MRNQNTDNQGIDPFAQVGDNFDSKRGNQRHKDWQWQKNVVRDIATVERLLGIQFGKENRQQLEQTLGKFPMRITPYYLSLVDVKDYEHDPIFLQSVPSVHELIVGKYDMFDPLEEDKDCPADCITHRYPDRVLFCVSNVCAMYCRHCTRKRKVGDIDQGLTRDDLQEGIEYIKKHRQFAMCSSREVIPSCYPMTLLIGFFEKSERSHMWR
jgi:lysine 2,3-aminomutase